MDSPNRRNFIKLTAVSLSGLLAARLNINARPLSNPAHLLNQSDTQETTGLSQQAATSATNYPYHLSLDGTDDYIEIPNSTELSVAPKGLSVAIEINPAVLNFPNTEADGYVHFMGKGEGQGTTGQQEWTFRMYNQNSYRPNRISFYVFNPDGHIGVGSYFQDVVVAGDWIQVVGVADSTNTYIYKDGEFRDSDQYSGMITPKHGTAPVRIGTRDFASYFEGAVRNVRMWNRPLSGQEVADLYSGTVPTLGLVAYYPFNIDFAFDQLRRHPGSINGATWTPGS